MKARDLMTIDVGFCTLDDSAATASAIMKQRNCGFIPVAWDRDSRILEGVLTDRDLALFIGTIDRPARDVKVREFCTRFPKAVWQNTDIHEVERLMEVYQIHRVPVINEIGRLEGVISLKDLALEAWREKGMKHPEITEKKIEEIIETIALAN